MKLSEMKNKTLIFNSIESLIDESVAKNTLLMTLWIKILSEIVRAEGANIEDRMIFLLNNLKVSMIEKFKTPFFDESDRKNFTEILNLIMFLRLKCDNILSRLKVLLPYNDVISILDIIKTNVNLTKFLFIEIINITIELIYLNREYYIQEIIENKVHLRSIKLKHNIINTKYNLYNLFINF